MSYIDDLKENSPKILPFQHEQEDNIHKKIIDFFKANLNPTDEQVHDFADSLGFNPDEFERHIYMVLTNYINNSILKNSVGKHRHIPDEEFDPEQLATGVQIEYEHTDDPEISKEIAKDHLAECRSYYPRLRELEASCEMEEKSGLKECSGKEQTIVSPDINPPEGVEKQEVDYSKPEEKCPCAAIKKASEEIEGTGEPQIT